MNQLITEDERRLLLEHGQARAAGRVIDPLPVVRLFTPDAHATWLLVSLDPADGECLGEKEHAFFPCVMEGVNGLHLGEELIGFRCGDEFALDPKNARGPHQETNSSSVSGSQVRGGR